MFFAFGRIFRMLVDIEPVMIEQESFDLEGYNKTNQAGVWGAPRVQQEGEEQEVKPSIYDTYDLDEEFENFNLSDFDWTFGLLANVPGLEFLMTLEGPFEFMTGFLNGT
jgi:hypothetical protein